MRLDATTTTSVNRQSPHPSDPRASGSPSFEAALAEAQKPRLSAGTIQAGFDSWLAQRQAQGASRDCLRGMTGGQDTCTAVVGKALDTGGFDQPVEFVKSLSPLELRALQDMQGLADPIDPRQLTEEGALNLLLPRGLSRDLDQDGLTQVGSAHLIIFPPNEAPPSVKDAWNQTMEGVDPGLRMDLELQLGG